MYACCARYVNASSLQKAGTSTTHKQHERSGRQGGRWFPLATATGVRTKLNCPINGSSRNWIVTISDAAHSVRRREGLVVGSVSRQPRI